MIIDKYLKQIVPRWRVKKLGDRDSNTDDMVDKQFYLVSSTVTVDDDLSTGHTLELFTDNILDNGIRFEVVEVYQLFLKDYNATKFIAKLQKIFPLAKADGVCFLVNSSAINITIERQEQGFLIELTFNIKGV